MKAAEIAIKAANLVGDDRQEQHGDKAQNFRNIETLWNAYMAIRRDPTAPFDAVDHALMMVLLKVARTQLGSFNADDFIDMAGYACCAGELASEG